MKLRNSSLIGALVLSAVTGSALAADEPPAVSHDGLELVPDSKVAVAYLLPEADFSGYKRVMILNATVAFRRNWQRDQNRGSIHKVRTSDVERMKRDMTELLREVFIEELEAKGGYELVDAPDRDVLLLRPAIIDLDVTAPDIAGARRSETYAASAGAATLVLEAYDSVSGQILARVVDRKAARDYGGFMRWTSKATNRQEAKEILTGWAQLLREGLDSVIGDREAVGSD